MACPRSRAAQLFNRTQHFNWDSLIAEHSTECVDRYRKFLVVKVLDDDLSLGPGLLHAPGAEIDSVWHSHLLRPSHYREVCAALTGSHEILVDHDPATAKRADVDERTARTARRIQELFDPARMARPIQELFGRPFVFRPDRDHQGGDMTIFIKNGTGRTMSLQIHPLDTIAALKTQITRQFGYPLVLQRLIFAGKQLEDGYTLNYYNIKTETTIHMSIQSLRGC